MSAWLQSIARRIVHAWTTARTAIAVRLGLWRGHWRRGGISVPAAATFVSPFAQHTWRYGLYSPPGLADTTAAPLIVLLHGCKQRALAFAQASGWVAAARRQRFRLLCPQQGRRANLWRCWNWFTPAAQRGAGEVLLLSAGVDAARARVAVSRVGLVGLSAGGGLAALAAFQTASRFDAVAVVAAPPLLGRSNLDDPREVMRNGLQIDPAHALIGQQDIAPLMIVHGAVDTVVVPRCGEQLLLQALAANARHGRPLTSRPSIEVTGGTQSDYVAIDEAGGAGAAVRVRMLRLDTLAHGWSGAPGGHAFVDTEGPPLTRLIVPFVLGTQSPASG